MEENKYKPFAITATALGHPRKLITPVTVVNINDGDELAAAKVNAMWDTGSEVCLMSRELAKILKVNFKKVIPGHGMFGEGDAVIGIAYVSLVSNGGLVDTYVAVVDSVSPTDEYSFIIGLDFIRKGCLAISTTALTTTLSFTIPSPEPIDFTKICKLADGSISECSLSKSKEDIHPVYGADVLALITDKDFSATI